MMNAVIVGSVDLSTRKQAPKNLPVEAETRYSRPLHSVLQMTGNENADLPVVALSMGDRVVASVRMIPQTGFADIVTMPDVADQGQSRVLRVRLNLPVVGMVRVKDLNPSNQAKLAEIRSNNR